MDSPPASKDKICQDEGEEVEPTAELGNPPGMATNITWEGKDSKTNKEREGMTSNLQSLHFSPSLQENNNEKETHCNQLPTELKEKRK